MSSPPRNSPAAPPFVRIAAELRHQITTGRLRAGERVPSTREIARDWRVAIATATKVLAVLRQEGLVKMVPGVGTVVEALAPPKRTGEARETSDVSRERIVHAAIQVADTEGLAALSMRRIARDLGVATMSLYRYVAGKEELVLHMADSAFGEERLPSPPPAGWRARLECTARLQWRLCQRHPWVAQITSMTRPQLVPSAMAHTEGVLAALEDVGLDARTRLHAATCLAAYVRGLGVDLEPEAQAEQETGVTADEWMQSQDATLKVILESVAFPAFSRLFAQPDIELDLDSMFEFGLTRLLDGFETLVRDAKKSRRH
jgi:AcrR family transcriptional regulator